MTHNLKLGKIARIATGSLGLGAAIVLVFMGAPAEAVVRAAGGAI